MQEVLERCLVEMDSLLRQVQIQKEELSEKEATVRELVSKVARLEAKLERKSAGKTWKGSSLHVPISIPGKDTKTKKQDLSASCKITMGAKVANDT